MLPSSADAPAFRLWAPNSRTRKIFPRSSSRTCAPMATSNRRPAPSTTSSGTEQSVHCKSPRKLLRSGRAPARATLKAWTNRGHSSNAPRRRMLQPLPGLCFRSGPSNQLPLRRSLQTRYRGLEEEGSEGAGGGIGDGIALVGAAAGIGERGGGLAEVVQEGVQDGIENAGHILCSEAALAKLAPQKRLLFPVPTMTANP